MDVECGLEFERISFMFMSRLIRCPYCLFQFDNTSWLVAHLHEVNIDDSHGHGQAKFSCELCYGTEGPSNLSASMFAHHLEMCHSVQKCKIAIANNKSTQIMTTESSMNVNQEICPFKLRRHQCPICNRCFQKIIDLKRHERTHSGERPFGCPECERSFKLKQALQTHQKTHQKDVLPNEHHICSICSKNFLSRSALKLHLRIHTGEAPFKCIESECKDTFRTKKLMLSHHRNSHKQPTSYQINLCHANQGYSDSDDFEVKKKERIIAFDELLGLHPCIGRQKFLTHSQQSAFNKFSQQKQDLQLTAMNKHEVITQSSEMDDGGFFIPEEKEQRLHITEKLTEAMPEQQTDSQAKVTNHRSIYGDNHQHEVNVHHIQQQQQHHQSSTNDAGVNFYNMRMFQAQPPAQQQPQQYYFQTADAEYTRDGQVHCRQRNPQPCHQYRTLTPTFVYYSNNEILSTTSSQNGVMQQQQMEETRQHNFI